MKRSPLQRRTFIRSKRKQRRRSSRVYDPEFIQWVKYTQPCSVTVEWPDVDLPPTPCDGPIEADHAGPRGYGQKSSDTECIALCKQHHEERTNRTGLSGSFKTLNRITAREWRARQIARHQQLYRESKGDAVTHPEEPATAWCEKCQATTYVQGDKCTACKPEKRKQTRTPEQAARARENIKRMRAERLAARRCLECNAGLQDEDTTQLCVECNERRKATYRRYRYRNRRRIRKLDKLAKRRQRKQDPEKGRIAMRARRERKILIGECLWCTKPITQDAYATCDFHRDVHLARRRNYYRRTKAKGPLRNVIDMRAYVGRPAMAKPEPKRKTRLQYRAFDHDDRALRNRILIAIRFHDWIAARDISDQMEIVDAHERNAVSTHMQRLVKDGLLEYRRDDRLPEYRITAGGKIECDQIRKGRAA